MIRSRWLVRRFYRIHTDNSKYFNFRTLNLFSKSNLNFYRLMKAGFFEILVLDQYLKSLKGAGFLSHPLNDKAYPLKVIGRIKKCVHEHGAGIENLF